MYRHSSTKLAEKSFGSCTAPDRSWGSSSFSRQLFKTDKSTSSDEAVAKEKERRAWDEVQCTIRSWIQTKANHPLHNVWSYPNACSFAYAMLERTWIWAARRKRHWFPVFARVQWGGGCAIRGAGKANPKASPERFLFFVCQVHRGHYCACLQGIFFRKFVRDLSTTAVSKRCSMLQLRFLYFCSHSQRTSPLSFSLICCLRNNFSSHLMYLSSCVSRARSSNATAVHIHFVYFLYQHTRVSGWSLTSTFSIIFFTPFIVVSRCKHTVYCY